ncbi:MAG: LptE family protein [Acidobacteriota bacterium]|jgi:outer membrane lipopolysaccharide assembly protein LptE/RlpB
MIRRILPGLLLLLAAACGYRLQGTGSLPPTVKTIAVLPFQKRVPVPELSQRVTEAVTRELARRSKIHVQSVSAGADAILTGSILSYSAVPVGFGSSGRANRFEVRMSARVQLTTQQGKVLFEAKGYRFDQIYEESPVPTNFINPEVVAYDRVANDFARALVSSILESGSAGSAAK